MNPSGSGRNTAGIGGRGGLAATGLRRGHLGYRIPPTAEGSRRRAKSQPCDHTDARDLAGEADDYLPVGLPGSPVPFRVPGEGRSEGCALTPPSRRLRSGSPGDTFHRYPTPADRRCSRGIRSWVRMPGRTTACAESSLQLRMPRWSGRVGWKLLLGGAKAWRRACSGRARSQRCIGWAT